jgi:hypothetical protein
MMDLLRPVTPQAWKQTSVRDPELLDAIWEALNIARDNKALVVAKGGTIININHLASELCGCSLQELVGKSVVSELFQELPTRLSGTPVERWETTLKVERKAPIPVEIIRQPFGTRLQGTEACLSV